MDPVIVGDSHEKVKAALPVPPPAPPAEKKEVDKDHDTSNVKADPDPGNIKAEGPGQNAPGGTPDTGTQQRAPGGTSDTLEDHVRKFIEGAARWIKAEATAKPKAEAEAEAGAKKVHGEAEAEAASKVKGEAEATDVSVTKPEEKKPAEQVKASMELVAKQARIDILEAKLAEKERVESIDKLVTSAEKTLSGTNITGAVRASLREFAALGEAPLGKYVELVRAGLPTPAPRDPDGATTAIKAIAAPGPEESEIMNVLGAQSPEIRARAKQFIDMGKRYIAATHSTATLKEYVLLNLKREGVQV